MQKKKVIIIGFWVLLLFLMAVGLIWKRDQLKIVADSIIKGTTCGNFVCETGENFDNCPLDCGFVGWYSNSGEGDKLAKIKSEGIDVILPYTFSDTYLSTARNANLKMVLPINKDWITSENVSEIKNMVQRYNSRAEVIGWYLFDEPENDANVTPQKLKIAFDAVKQISTKPIFMTFSVKGVWGNYKDSFDIGMHDDYPIWDGYEEFDPRINFGRIPSLVENLSNFSKANSKPYSAFVAQGFGDGQLTRRLPTLNEERYMVYTAYIHGAKRVLFWTHYRANQNWIDTVLAPLVKNEIKPIVMPLLNLPPIEGRVKSSNNKIHFIFREKGSKFYLIAANDSNEKINKITFTLPVENYKIRVLFENRSSQMSGNTFSDTFTPYQVHVYELEKTTTPAVETPAESSTQTPKITIPPSTATIGSSPSDKVSSDLKPMKNLAAFGSFEDNPQVSLSWSASPTKNIDGYRIYRKTKNTNYKLVGQTKKNTLIFIDSKQIEEGKEYIYMGRSYFQNLESANSNQIQVVAKKISSNTENELLEKRTKYLLGISASLVALFIVGLSILVWRI